MPKGPLFLTMKLLLSILAFVLAALGFAAGEVSWKVLRLEGKAPSQTAVVEATIQPGWHLYSTVTIPDGPFPTAFSAEGATVGEKIGEEGLVKEFDKGFNKEVSFFKEKALFWVPLKAAGSADKIKLSVMFQVCKDGVCIPPTPAELPVAGAEVTEAVTEPKATSAKTEPTEPKATSTGNGSSEAEQIKKAQEAGVIPFLLLSIAAGATALLTPCVFPMIPITVSFFSKRKEEGSGVKQALLFCGGIVGTFTFLGIIVAVFFGATGLNQLVNNPWFNLGMGSLFVILAFSLFGVFEIGLPPKLVNKFDASGKKGWIAPVLMGLTFSLTSFTCTLPFVGGVLVSAANGNYFWPVLGMLGFSGTFSIPFFLLALFPSAISKVPRSGAWMVVIKAYMGFIELVAATKFFSSFDLGFSFGFLTREVMLSLWFALLLGAALYCFGAIKLPKVDDGKIGWFRRGVGALTLALSVWVLMAFGETKLGQLEGFLPPSPYPGKSTAAATGWKSLFVESWEEAKAKAKETGKPIFVDFTGVYCTNCRVVEQNIFTKKETQEKFKNFVPVSIFIDRVNDPAHAKQDAENAKMMQRMVGTVTLPTYAIVTPDGEMVKSSWAFTDNLEEFLGKLDAGLK
jgi:thiol:disulfide interchange protein